MVAFIERCNIVDEIVEAHAQASALELYAAQAMNTESERLASNVRIRAERRAGELLAALERGGGGDRKSEAAKNQTPNNGTFDSEFAAALTRTGVPRQTAHRWQQLARVSNEDFEQKLNGEKPSTNSILRDARTVDGSKSMSDDSLWLWGRLRDWERMEFFSKDPKVIVGGMTAGMVTDLARILPLFVDWIAILKEEAK
jgi:hypothetical protein